MGRPRKDSGEKGAEERMINTFWHQISLRSFQEITATSIVHQAGCNRATFYYYFDSIEDLVEKAVDASVPTGIADLAERFLSQSDVAFHLNKEQKLAVERICLLTGPNGSRRLIERFKRVLMEAWAGKFELDLRQEDVQAVASFMASGIVGLLGEQAGKPCDERFDRCLQIISKVFSASAIEFAHNKSKAGSE